MRAFIETDPKISGITQITTKFVPPCGGDIFTPPGSRDDARRDEGRLGSGKGTRRLPRAPADLDGKSFPHTNAYGEEVIEEVPASHVPTVVGQTHDSGSREWIFWGTATVYAFLLVKAVRMVSSSWSRGEALVSES
jgi:hypothetical protein